MNKQTKSLSITFLDFDDIKNPLLGAGQARATLEVGQRLVGKGHKLLVICSRYPGSKDRKQSGIYYKHIGIGTNNIRLNNIFYIISLPFYVAYLKTDIIVECFTAPISTLFTPLFTKTPVVGLTTSFEAERFSELYHIPFDKIQNFGLKFYKYAMPYTKYLENKIKKENKDIITHIIPEGVSEDYFDIERKKPKYILFLGRIDIGQKGLDLLIKAYARVSNSVPPLVIAGIGPDEEKLHKMIKQYNLSDKISFVGPAYGAKKKTLLSEALFVAFPSRHEGFSLFSLEALAAGAPLVAFDIPGLSWVSSNECLKAKKFDVVSYSKLLLQASNSKMISYMSVNSRNLARKYSWENVSSLFESFFQEILNNHTYAN